MGKGKENHLVDAGCINRQDASMSEFVIWELLTVTFGTRPYGMF